MNIRKQTIRRLWPIALVIGPLLSFGILTSSAEIAGYPASVRAYDAREIATLPRYCIYTQDFREKVATGDKQAEIERWTSMMGPTFEAMHHYCWGLMKTRRANILSRTKQDRQFYLDDAVSEFDYVLQRAPADFVMLPEILTRKGENLLRLGRSPQALTELQRAIDLKPDYWPPYEFMAEHFRSAGDVTKAREVLEKGLSFSPASKTLKLRLTELDEPPSKRKSAP